MTIIELALPRKNVPAFLKENFDISFEVALALMESVDVQRLVVPETELEVAMLEPGEPSGVLDDAGTDAHGITKLAVRVEGDGFKLVVQHLCAEHGRSWKVTASRPDR